MQEVHITNRIVLMAESAAEAPIVREIERLGFTAYWSLNCTGRGGRAIVHDVFTDSTHVRIEALGPRFIAQQLLQFVREKLSHFSITCFTDLVDVSGDVVHSN